MENNVDDSEFIFSFILIRKLPSIIFLKALIILKDGSLLKILKQVYNLESTYFYHNC